MVLRLWKGVYIISLLIAFTSIRSGDWTEVLIVFFPALVGLSTLSAAMSGLMERRIGALAFAIAAGVGVALF